MSKFADGLIVSLVYLWMKAKKFFEPHFQRIGKIGRKSRDWIVRKLGGEKNAKWLLSLAGKWALILLIFVTYSIVLCRTQYAKASKAYEAYYEAWYADQLKIYVETHDAEQAALEAERNAPPTEEQVKQVQAEELARLLYGVKDNSTDDLRTLCWCVFNRVDNTSYPNTIEAVISQPSQWMGYNHGNVVLEDLYQIAYEEMTKWQSGSHRPVSNEYVFMNWSASGIVLRNTFNENAATRYWRVK